MESHKPASPLWHAVAMILCFWVLTTWLTWDAPHSDGQRMYGFPLAFYSWGGLCIGKGVCESVKPLWIVVDVVILIGLPLLIRWLERRLNWLMPLAFKLLLVMAAGVSTNLLFAGWMGFLAQYVVFNLGVWRPH